MAGAFFDSFNPALPDMEAQFTETWNHNGVDWPAIVIDTLDADQHVIKGGTLLAAKVNIIVRDDVFNQSGVQIGDPVSARGIDMAVNRVDSDGDAAKTLVCVPRGLDIWR